MGAVFGSPAGRGPHIERIRGVELGTPSEPPTNEARDRINNGGRRADSPGRNGAARAGGLTRDQGAANSDGFSGRFGNAGQNNGLGRINEAQPTPAQPRAPAPAHQVVPVAPQRQAPAPSYNCPTFSCPNLNPCALIPENAKWWACGGCVFVMLGGLSVIAYVIRHTIAGAHALADSASGNYGPDSGNTYGNGNTYGSAPTYSSDPTAIGPTPSFSFDTR